MIIELILFNAFMDVPINKLHVFLEQLAELAHHYVKAEFDLVSYR